MAYCIEPEAQAKVYSTWSRSRVKPWLAPRALLRRAAALPTLAMMFYCIGTGFSERSCSAAPLNGRAPVDDVFYQFMPIAWRDSNNDAQRFGDFDGMTASLDYLQNLG